MLDVLIARFAQPVLYVMIAASAVIFYLCGIVAALSGWWLLLALGMLLISPVMMALLRVGFEGPVDRPFVDPHDMSWAFVAGDGVLLPLALMFAAHGWLKVDLTAHELLLATLIYPVVGIGVAVGFRSFDGARYRSVGWASALVSPTKLWHDFVVVPVVVSLMMWLLVPQLLTGPTGDTYLTVIVLVSFIGLVAVDGVNPPDPRRQHTRWDPRRFEPSDA